MPSMRHRHIWQVSLHKPQRETTHQREHPRELLQDVAVIQNAQLQLIVLEAKLRMVEQPVRSWE